jgi:2-dehydro-3-deoxygluconokinase
MGRLAAPGYQRLQQAMPGGLEATFAGAEANVAMSLAHLGTDASFVTALPQHAIADACVATLRAAGVETKHILRTPHGRLGLYFVEAGVNQRPGNVIYDREGSSVAITPAKDYPWDEIFDGAGWFHFSGITPAISKNAAAVVLQALREAAARGVRISCDLNFRTKLWTWKPGLRPHELATLAMRELLPFVHVLIGGREDVAAMMGIHAPSGATDPVLDVARQIRAQYPHVSHVAMTLRKSLSATHHNWGGMLYDGAQDEVYLAPLNGDRYQPYAITDIVDRLGAGDAFAAGLIYALTHLDPGDPQTALSFAVAASCLAHSIPGDFNFTSRDEVEALMAGVGTGRINR